METEEDSHLTKKFWKKQWALIESEYSSQRIIFKINFIQDQFYSNHDYVEKFMTSYIVVLFCHFAFSWVYMKDQAVLDFFSCPGLNKIDLE